MHTYQQRWPEDRSPSWRPPRIDEFVFRDAYDVAGYAELNPVVAWRTYPDVWHLGEDGRLQCCSMGSSLDSVRTFARRPAEMLECRREPVDAPCPDRWVVVEPRHPWLLGHYEVAEDDARAFGRLRRWLARRGITLLDVVIFDQEFHWWSLHELTSGSTAWPPALDAG